MDYPESATKFRWRFDDDTLGDHWSAWHSVQGPCSACCCGGPKDGAHLEGAGYYDEDGFLDSGHSRMDPRQIDAWDEVEFSR